MFDDKFLTAKDAYIRNFTVSIDSSCVDVTDGMGRREFMKGLPDFYTMDLQIVTPYCNLEEVLLNNRIRDKRVEDCTIHELIIAINNKI